MKTAGIIAEYNPFHNGHLYQLEKAREITGADYLVIAMSGDYVQRGLPALLPKHVRAEMALRAGADLVLELPVRFSCASAEFFSGAGVDLLDSLGVVDHLCFGNETGNAGDFLSLAQVLLSEPQKYQEELRRQLSAGLSFPAARSRALSLYLSAQPDQKDGGLSARAEELLSSPNNILGIEYCKALLRRKSSIRPVPIERKGSGYHDEDISEGHFASASAVRKAIFDSDAVLPLTDQLQTALSDQIPESSLELLTAAVQKNAFIADRELDALLPYRLWQEDAASLLRFSDITEDLAQKIIKQRRHCRGFLQYAAHLKSKDLTLTRIQRVLLHILLEITNTAGDVPYARVLGMKKSASPLLRAISQNSRIPLVTKTAQAARLLDKYGQQVLEETVRTSCLYESILSQRSETPFVHEYEKPVVIL